MTENQNTDSVAADNAASEEELTLEQEWNKQDEEPKAEDAVLKPEAVSQDAVTDQGAASSEESATDTTETKEEVSEPPEGAAPDESAQVDVWEGISEAQAEALESLRNQERSSSGRIGAFQRKTNKLEAELEALKAKLESVGTDKPEQKAESAKPGDDPLANVSSELPEVAPLVEQTRKVQEQFQAESAQMKAHIEALQKQNADFMAQQTHLLIQARHPDYKALEASGDFWTWVDKQPVEVKNLSEGGSDDVCMILDQYKSHRLATAERAKQLTKSRAQRAEKSIDISGKGSIPAAVADDDLAGLWATIQ